jgi:hypothetical protein
MGRWGLEQIRFGPTEARALRGSFQRIGRWLWLPAWACAIVGVFGLADFPEAELSGRLLLVAPHLVGAGMTTLGGYYHPWAGIVGLAGSVVMAGLSWWDKLDRLPDPSAFHNALAGMFYLVANYVILSVVVCVISVLIGYAQAHRPAEQGAPAYDGRDTDS